MKLKGMKEFRAKAPAFSGAKIAILPVYVIIMLIISFRIMILAYSVTSSSADKGVSAYLIGLSPLIAYLFIGSVGFLLAQQMWHRRTKMKEKYGPLAYQRMFPIGLGGIVWVMSLAFNLYVPFL